MTTTDSEHFSFGDTSPANGRDDTFDPPDDASEASVYDSLMAVLKEDVALKPLELVVTTRKNVSLVYDLNVDARMIGNWQQRSTNEKRRNAQVDMVKFASLIIANTCIEIRWNGKQAFEKDNLTIPLTFRSREVLSMFNAMDTASAIRSFFGADSQMINHAVRILSEAGFSEDAETFEEMGDTPLG